MKQQFLEDKAATIRLQVYDSNNEIVPSSANVTLYTPSGSVLQAQTAATIDGTTGEMTYVLTTTHTATRDLNYKAVWDYVSGGTTYYETQLFDVVRSILSISVIDDDLYNELESLRVQNKQATGTATGGAAGTLIDTARRKETDDFWNGGTIEIISGTGDGQKRAISDFAQSTATISVSPNWTTTPDTTSVYRIVRSYTNKIRQSFEKIETMLYNKGKRHELILESSQIEFPLLYLTVHHICLDLMNEEGDKWELLATRYWDKFNDSFNQMTLEYDEDDSGTIEGDEEEDTITSLRIGRA